MIIPSTSQTPSQVYDTWIAELTASKQKLADELYSVTAEINAAEQEKQNANKHKIPENLVEAISEQVQCAVQAFLDDLGSNASAFDVELSIDYDNKINVENIDLSSIHIPVEDFISQAFEDECVITTSTDVDVIKS